MKIINLQEIKNNQSEHIVQPCICLECRRRFVDVRPYGVLLKDLECPGCHTIGNIIGSGEIIDGENIDSRSIE